MFSNVSLVPHAVCWAAAPHLIWTMVITNAITFLSYVTICFTLLGMAHRTRRVIARDWAYFTVGFALFIVACGSTHLLEVITTWSPIFWVDAWTNIITAVLSAWVAINLILRASTISFGINDYAERLASTEREKQRIEESLLAAQRLEEWSRISTVMAHEINTPLEIMQNLLYLLRSSDGLSPEALQLVHSVEEETARVVEITRSTLSFFRQTTSPEIVDLARAAESVRFLVAPLLLRHEIRVEVIQTGDTTIRALPGEIRQVLLNMVRNACEATQKQGASVVVRLTGDPEGVRVTIDDQGSGIHPDLLPELFQFGKSTKGEHGNGMGLWTVKHIVERHGGSVRVESSSPEGTRFVLFFPREFVSSEPQARSVSVQLSHA